MKISVVIILDHHFSMKLYLSYNKNVIFGIYIHGLNFDRKQDMIGANCNGMDFIGVLYGYEGKEDFKRSRSNICCEICRTVAFHVKGKRLIIYKEEPSLE